MSYQSRKKKRAYNRAVAKAKRSPETARRWFLTVAKRPGKCSTCGDAFKRGAEIVFRFEPRAVRCLRCGERQPDSRSFRASRRWEKSRRMPKAA